MSDILQGHPVFGRPFRPVALGVTILMLSFIAIPVFGLAESHVDSGRGWFDLFNMAAAGTSAGLLITGWWRQSLKLAEWGLLVATFAYMMRVTHLLIEEPMGSGPWLATGVLVIIAGSYILEVDDRRRKEWTR